MRYFPKKYNPKDLLNRSSSYKKNIINKEDSDKLNTIFSLNTLPCSKQLSYHDFFQIYLKDFFNYKNLVKDKRNDKELKNMYTHLFIIFGNQIQDIQSNFEFFNKKGQTLLKIGINKLERRIKSSNKKHINANNKIIDNYFSSNHKIYIPDFDLYIYILEQFHSLWNNGKIKKETKIGYRSFNLQTSIPTEDIVWKEEKTPFYILKYFIGVKCEALPVYVDDIDSCCGDVALLVHPKDKRYNKYIGKNAIIPLCNRQIPIIGDENVNIAVNNGIQRICPCFNDEDIRLAKKFGLPTDIYIFNKEGLYTEYIHEKAFIGKDRKKYYSNIVGFMEDIGNLSSKGEIIKKIPYLNNSNERLLPYKMDQIIIDVKEEKQKLIEKFFNRILNFSFLDINYGESESKHTNIYEEKISPFTKKYKGNNGEDENEEIMVDKQEIINKIDKYLPNHIICNSQIPYLWRLPFITNSDGNLEFFDIEKEYLKQGNNPTQTCFDFILLYLYRAGIIGKKSFGNNNNSQLCEYDKFPLIIFENEKKIKYLIQYLSKITGNKLKYSEFLKIIENITDENDSTLKELIKLIENSKFLKHESNKLSLNINGISDDTFDGDFIQSCIPCYLYNKNININNQMIFSKNERNKIFKELLIQELLLGHTISENFIEYSYDEKKEFLGDKQLTKLQIKQSQRNLFSIYGENPVRLCFLVNKAFDQKEILLNNIFLKQIWNATRLCIQKDFLPKNIEESLKNVPENFDDYDISVLFKLNELYYDRENIKTYDDYIKFFKFFKNSIQNIFFSRYLEIQKTNPTKDNQFVCSYFFNFLLNVLYPLVPEFIDALHYISNREFLKPIKPLHINKTPNYNMHILYNAFIKIKEMKIEHNIKQHESCNIFIKSSPTIGDIFAENEHIFKNYFHISEISYFRLHETNPLGYEIFSDDTITIGIQPGDNKNNKEKDSLERIEKEIKNLDDKLGLLRQHIQILPEGEQRSKVEEEYAKTKEEMEELTIKHSLLSSK